MLKNQDIHRQLLVLMRDQKIAWRMNHQMMKKMIMINNNSYLKNSPKTQL